MTKQQFVIGEGVSRVTIVNPGDRDFYPNRFVLAFGAYGWTKLLAYASCLESALDECIDWVVDHEPGLLCDEDVAEEYDRLVSEYRVANPGCDDNPEEWPDDAHCTIVEQAEQDTTTGGNAGNRIMSSEWHVIAENPTRAQLFEIAGVK